MVAQDAATHGIGPCCTLYCIHGFGYGDKKWQIEQIQEKMDNPTNYKDYNNRGRSFMAIVSDEQNTPAVKDALEELGFKRIESVPTVHGNYMVHIYLKKGVGSQ